MYDRLLRIDDLTRPDHTFVKPDDDCYYMGEYTARGGSHASPTNDLIINLKKPMDRRGRAEWKYKARAIRTAGDHLRRVLRQPAIEAATFVPVPPSKAKNDPLYDDRLMQILARMSAGFDTDVRELVLQRQSIKASHESDWRPQIDELVENYYINEELADAPLREHVVIFDDLLTTGRHYKAMQTTISERFPDVLLRGLFLARRVPNTDDLGVFF